MPKTAAVLGGGIQGCCAALALARKGFQVKMFEKCPELYSRASANQEGKLHLGIVYARDRTLKTARRMIHDAMRFAPVIEDLLGATLDWEPHLSRRFYCGIHKESSLSVDEHLTHFSHLQDIYDEIIDDSELHYMGRRFSRLWKDEPGGGLQSDALAYSVYTEEAAVDPAWLRTVIVGVVEKHPDISVVLNHAVLDVAKNHQSLIVSGQNGKASWMNLFDIVVNCLWEGRERIDQTVGLDGGSVEWTTRIKYGFYAHYPSTRPDISSLIVTHGPYGDLVHFPGSESVYLSWYPSCMTWFGHADDLPAEWDNACNADHPEGKVNDIFNETKRHLSAFVPEVADVSLMRACAGTIVGHGNKDIDDAASELHHRQGIGVSSYGDYYSIFTGKFTSAPANARELIQEISGAVV